RSQRGLQLLQITPQLQLRLAEAGDRFAGDVSLQRVAVDEAQSGLQSPAAEVVPRRKGCDPQGAVAKGQAAVQLAHAVERLALALDQQAVYLQRPQADVHWQRYLGQGVRRAAIIVGRAGLGFRRGKGDAQA